MRVLSLTLLVTLSTSCIAFADEPKLPKWVTHSGRAWQPPPEGVVRDKWAAVEIAHSVWFSLWRTLPIADVRDWQRKMNATLTDGVWQVTEPVPAGMVGGSVFVFISAKDGRVLNVSMTQ
jgi:hypothetical protein